ncbi:MAG: phage tail protein [Gaiellaceae bacterium]
MPASTRRDPFKNFSFLAEIDGVAAAAFSSVSGLAAEAEVIEYRELGGLQSIKLPGRIRYPNVTLRRGLTTSRDLWDWWQTVSDGRPQRRGVLIVLLDDAGQPVLRWSLREAWPVKWELSELDASKNEVAIETLELAHEGLELV